MTPRAALSGIMSNECTTPEGSPIERWAAIHRRPAVSFASRAIQGISMQRSAVRLALLLTSLLSCLLACLLESGCRPSSEVTLPPEDDLYVYCRAVAERARRKVPDAAALGVFHVGRVEERFGLEDKALEIYEQATEINPGLADAYLQIGFILSQRNERHPEAIEAYQQALRADPKAPGAYTRIGLIYLHQNKLKEAEEVLREELRIGSADENTHYNLGQTLALGKRHEEAIASYKKALELDPYMRMAHYAISQAYLALDRNDEAEESLKEFRELKKLEDEARVDPTPGSSNRKDQLLHASDTWLDAAYLFIEGGRRAKDPGKRKQFRGEFLHAAEEALRFDPKNPKALNALVDYHRAQHNYAEAADFCERVLAVAPTRMIIPVAYELAGKNLEGVRPGAPGGRSRVDRALRVLRRLVEVVPSFSHAHRELSRVILFHRPEAKELLAEALTHARRAVELDPSAENYDILAFALAQSGKRDDARAALEEGLRTNPEDAGLKKRLQMFLAQQPKSTDGP